MGADNSLHVDSNADLCLSTPALKLLAKVRAALPGGEQRPGQEQMAAAVEEAVVGEHHLICEAGCGVGKSVAYGVPLGCDWRTAVVVTSSITLQEQVSQHDLPLVGRHADNGLSVAVLKGRSNYLCQAKLADLTGRQTTGSARQGTLSLFDDSGDTDDDTRRLLAWAKTTASGDRSEFDGELPPALWAEVSCTSQECPGADQCSHGTHCFAEAAHQRAEQAQVVVVNTHLYAMHVASRGKVLPPHDVVVFDEAHDVERIFSEAIGAEVNAAILLQFARSAAKVLTSRPLLGALRRAAKTLGKAVEAEAGGGDGRHTVALRRGVKAHPAVADALSDAGEAVRAVWAALTRIPVGADAGVRERIARAQRFAESLAGDIDTFSQHDPSVVVWIAGGDTLRAAPKDIGAVLDRWLWAQSDDGDIPPPATAIFTSATIPSNLAARLHIPQPVELNVGSHFDFERQGLIYVPRIADPKRAPDRWQQDVIAQVVDLADIAGGRMLALFTSTGAMRRTVEAVAPAIVHRILVQGAASKRQMLEQFIADETSCLFATRSFFQGVDVPGAALSVVVLDRIPFPPPDDPLVSAWTEAAGGGWAGFRHVGIPIAATVLCQAAGRLIRTASDRGVVAVLDPRLAEASYRQMLLDKLPPMPRTRSRQRVVGFFNQVGADVQMASTGR